MRSRFVLPWILLVALALGCSGSGGEGDDQELLVFAAASLRDALEATAAEFEAAAGAELSFNFAGSNLLALQIEAAPRADVYLSANERWMDYLEERDLLAPGSRRTLLSNGLVVVANQHAGFQLDDPRSLPQLPFRFLSLADPEAVPAGHYARQYLEGLEVSTATGQGKVWDAVASRVAPAPDVRAALALVEAEPEIIGIVYRTDAAASSRVRVLYEVPLEEGPQIRYSAAVVGESSHAELARRYLEFLKGSAARKVFEEQGFVVLDPDKEAVAGGG